MKTSTIRKISFSSITIILLFVLWVILSATKNNEMIYPSLGNIFKEFLNCFQGSNLLILLKTLLRVLITLGLSLAFSLVVLILYILYKDSYAFFAPIIKIMRSVPFICLSLFIVLFFERNVAPYIMSFLVIIPLMVDGLIGGVNQISKGLKDDLAMHDVSFFARIFKIYLPILFPNFMVIILQTFGLCLKVMIMGEYFAQMPSSLGLLLYNAKSYLEISVIMAWTIMIVLLVALIEIVVHIFSRKWNEMIN